MYMSYLKQSNQPRYALVVIYTYIYIYIFMSSKYVGVQPINNKVNESVYEALLKSFKVMQYPVGIYSDGDSAFKATVK